VIDTVVTVVVRTYVFNMTVYFNSVQP